jgi:ribosome-binding protein aMBF1 (putative translation factor)
MGKGDFLAPLARAERLLAVRLAVLERMLEADQIEDAAEKWEEYLSVLAVYLQVIQRMAPNPSMSTAQLAERFGVTPRTIRRRHAKGEIAPEATGRGRAGFRWAGQGS